MALFTIKSVQRGTITLSGTTQADAAGITTVDVNKSLLSNLGQSNAVTSGEFNNAMVRIALAGATTVRANKNSPSEIATVSFELVEYY